MNLPVAPLVRKKIIVVINGKSFTLAVPVPIEEKIGLIDTIDQSVAGT